MKYQTVELSLNKDELGEDEEFSWDLFPIIAADDTRHLDENGLPKPGTIIKEGMIVIGKIGKSKAYNDALQPTSLEKHGLKFEELKSKYGHMWYDASLYADAQMLGRVKEAQIIFRDGRPVAIVKLET